MAERKRCNAHELYPAGRRPSPGAVETAPGHYKTTADDTAYPDAMGFLEYEEETLMPPYEKRILRREPDAIAEGLAVDGRTAYRGEQIGYVDKRGEARPASEENARIRSHMPETAEEKIRMLQRRFQYTWMFLIEEGIWEQADEYVRDHMDEPTPFEAQW